MLGRTPGNIVAIKPMKDGVIADFDVTEKMLTYFIKKAHNGTVWVRPRIVIGVPSEITQVEKRAVKDSAYRAKASEVHLVEEAMAAAIGAGLPIEEPSRQHGGRHRRRHHRHRRHLAGRHRLQQGGARRRQRDGRGDHPLHQEGLQPAHRRAHRRGDQDRSRLGLPARRDDRRWRSRAATSSRACPRPSPSATRRSAWRWPRRSTSSSTRCAWRSSARRRNCRPTSSTAASCSPAAARC